MAGRPVSSCMASTLGSSRRSPLLSTSALSLLGHTPLLLRVSITVSHSPRSDIHLELTLDYLLLSQSYSTYSSRQAVSLTVLFGSRRTLLICTSFFYRYTNTLLYALNRRPISDPRYQSQSSTNKSRSQQGQGQNSSGGMPSFGVPAGAANPHSLSAPRVRISFLANMLNFPPGFCFSFYFPVFWKAGLPLRACFCSWPIFCRLHSGISNFLWS